MKKSLLTLFCTIGLIGPSVASNVVLSNGAATGPRVTTNGGALVGNGMLVRVGYFTNIADLSTFVEFGTTATATAATLTSRIAANPVTNTNGEGDDAQFNGQDVYLWVYNSAVINPAAEQGIFRASDAAAAALVSPNWDFPTDGGALDSVTLLVDAVDIAISAPGQTGAAVIPGGAPGIAGGTTKGLRLGAIPEPSTGLLCLVTGLFLFRRRR
jgi:hypothetical protein